MNLKNRFRLTSQDYYEQTVRPVNPDNARVYFGKMVRLVKKVARRIGKKKAMVLEIGCGEAIRLTMAQKKFPNLDLAGVDLSPTQIKAARKKVKKAKLLTAGAEKLPYKNDSFNLVFINALLHHVDNIPGAVKEAVRVCAPGGYLIVIEPNRFSPLPLASGLFKKQERRLLGFSYRSLRLLVLKEPVEIVKESRLNSLLFPFQKFPGKMLFGFFRWLEDSKLFPDFLKSHFVFVLKKQVIRDL